MGPEKRYEEKIKGNLRKRGAWFAKYFGNGYAQRGVPDVLCCYCGWFLGIEIKGGTNSYGLTDAQRQQLQQIADAGGIRLAVEDYEKTGDRMDCEIIEKMLILYDRTGNKLMLRAPVVNAATAEVRDTLMGIICEVLNLDAEGMADRLLNQNPQYLKKIS